MTRSGSKQAQKGKIITVRGAEELREVGGDQCIALRLAVFTKKKKKKKEGFERKGGLGNAAATMSPTRKPGCSELSSTQCASGAAICC